MKHGHEGRAAFVGDWCSSILSPVPHKFLVNGMTEPTIIFTCDFDERTAWEAEQKGWFEAIAVRLPCGPEIPLAFRDPVRLAQDLEFDLTQGRFCIAELALIVIPKVTKYYMENAIRQLYADGYFDRLVAIGRKTEMGP